MLLVLHQVFVGSAHYWIYVVQSDVGLYEQLWLRLDDDVCLQLQIAAEAARTDVAFEAAH
jgi:hypothetical protein